MDYFRFNTLPLVDKTLCILELGPEGCSTFKYMMATGKPAAQEYPGDAKWSMTAKYPGIKVASIIDNTARLVVAHRDVKDVFVATGVPMECFPFTLYDHKGRVASTDHFIVNVLGTFDCLNLQKSEIDYSKTYPDKILGIDRYVLDPRKLEHAPDIFRIKEDPYAVVLSHRLVDQLRPVNPTNLFLVKLDQEA